MSNNSQHNKGFNASLAADTITARRFFTETGTSINHNFNDVMTFASSSVTTFEPGAQVYGLPSGNDYFLPLILQSIQNMSPMENDQTIYSTGPDTFAVTTLSPFGRSLMDDADTTTAQATLGLVIGTNVQAQDSVLQSLVDLGPYASNDMIYATGDDTFAKKVTTSFGRDFLGEIDAASTRGTIEAVKKATTSTSGAVALHDGNDGLLDTGILVDVGDNLTMPGASNLVMGTGDMGGITSVERTQLANINGTTIGTTEWGHVGAMNQDVATTDKVTFDDVTVLTSTLGGDSGKRLTTKDYVDALALSGQPPLEAVKLAGFGWNAAFPPAGSIGPVPSIVTGDVNDTPLIIDGVTITAGQVGWRFLQKDSGTPKLDGIYTVTTVGTAGVTGWTATRTPDFDENAVPISAGTQVFVDPSGGGINNSNHTYALAATVTDLVNPTGDDVIWQQIGGVNGYTASAGIQLVGLDFQLDSPVLTTNGGTGVSEPTTNRVLIGAGAAAVDLTKEAPTGAFVGTDDSQTLENKIFETSTGLFSDESGSSKRLQFNLTGISNNQTRIASWPNSNMTVVGETQLQLLLNKQMDDSTTTFINTADETKQLRFLLNNVTGSKTLLVPNGNTTICGTDYQQTILNKELVDGNVLFVNVNGGSKKMRFEVGGITNGNTRVMTIPDADLTVIGQDQAVTLTNKTIVDANSTIRATSIGPSGNDVEVFGSRPAGAGYTIQSTGTGAATWQPIAAGGGGGGDVFGPTGATENRIAVYSGDTGKIIKESGVEVDTDGNLNIVSPLRSLQLQGIDYLKKYGGTTTVPDVLCVGPTNITSSATTSGSTFVGANTGFSNTSGINTTAVGKSALAKVSTGEGNTGVGFAAGFNINTGESNTCLGLEAGGPLTTGSFNVLVGDNADTSASSTANAVGIGHDSTVATDGVAIGQGASAVLEKGTAVGKSSTANSNCVAVGFGATTSADGAIAIGKYASATVANTCSIGSVDDPIHEFRVPGLHNDGTTLPMPMIKSGTYTPVFDIIGQDSNRNWTADAESMWYRIGNIVHVSGVILSPQQWTNNPSPNNVVYMSLPVSTNFGASTRLLSGHGWIREDDGTLVNPLFTSGFEMSSLTNGVRPGSNTYAYITTFDYTNVGGGAPASDRYSNLRYHYQCTYQVLA